MKYNIILKALIGLQIFLMGCTGAFTLIAIIGRILQILCWFEVLRCE